MSSKKLGMTCVVDERNGLLGIITDGDLRRHMSNPAGLFDRTAEALMTRNPVVVDESMLAAEALNIMERRKITSLVVVSGPDKAVAGVVHLHDLWRTGLV
jgi:arabinose-5-phosphate isomerase